jgi:hypothetical protein
MIVFVCLHRLRFLRRNQLTGRAELPLGLAARQRRPTRPRFNMIRR